MTGKEWVRVDGRAENSATRAKGDRDVVSMVLILERAREAGLVLHFYILHFYT